MGAAGACSETPRDVAAAQVGLRRSIVNANDDIAVFCPTHDAFDDMAGTGRVNPLPMLRTVSAMLHWQALDQAARALDRALSACEDAALHQSWILPGGTSTSVVTDAIVRSIGG